MKRWTSKADGADMLMLSLKLRCLSEASKTPVRTFFRFVTLFYEKGCMRTPKDADPDSAEVVTSQSCIDKVFATFTEDPLSIEKCLWDTFETAGDIESKNLRLDADAILIDKEYHDERFRNPSLFIDGEPYHEPIYPDPHFAENQMIADVCAALFQNMMFNSNYCLHFLNSEFTALEDYTVEHRREIGKNLKAHKSAVRSRPLGMFAMGIGFAVLLVCNCVAWTVMRVRQKRKADRMMRSQVNE